MKFDLNRISVYNPNRLDDEELKRGFIVRHGIFEELMEGIAAESATSIPQHHLIIGQRGMGKTTLLRRIAIELRTNEVYSHRFIPLSFPEEQYNLDRLSKFWLNCLDSLADTLEILGKDDYVTLLDDQIKEIEKIKNDDELVNKAFTLFQEILEKLQQRPVLLIDNLNQIFDALKENEHWGLRNQITKNSSPILIGASAAPLEETYEYSAAFYDSFILHYLEPLSYLDFCKVIQTFADQLEDKTLSKTIPSKKGRLEALFNLTGGNPRTTVLLFQVFANGFAVDIYKDLDALLESITPLYKARFEELSVQLQVIVDAIALNWYPCKLETIRNLTRLENHQLSPQLKRLIGMGWLSKIKPSQGKGTAYEIGERFFNVWYLMRRSSRRQKRNLVSLTRFLETFYGEKIDDAAKQLMGLKSEHLQHVTVKLALSEATKSEQLKSSLQESAYAELLEFSKSDERILHQFDVPEETHYKALVRKVEKLESEEKYKEVEPLLLTFISKHSNTAPVWDRLGNLYQNHLKKYEEAEKAYRKAILINSKYELPWYGLGYLYKVHLNKYEEAEKAYKKAIQINPKYEVPWHALGNLYKEHLNKYEEAEKAYKKAIQINSNFEYPWNGLGNLYQEHFNKNEEAEKAYKKAIQINPKFELPWNGLGNLYKNHLNKYEEAEKAYKKAISLNSKYKYSWYNLGLLYSYNLNEYEEAELAYKKAIEINPKFEFPWNGIGNLYQDHLNKYEEAELAYKKAIQINPKFEFPWNGLGNLYQDHLNKYEEAELAYKKAIEINPKYEHPWNGLGNLYKEYLNKYEEAELAYKKAIQINPNHKSYWNTLGNLYQLHLHKYEDAEKAYKKAIQNNPKSEYPWHGLGYLYKNYLFKYEDAEKAYLKSIQINPKYDASWNGLGNLYTENLNKYEEAELAYLKDIELDPKSYFSWNGLGNLYQGPLNRYEEAEKAYRKAIEINPNYERPWNGLGYLYFDHLMQYEEAEKAYKKAILINPNFQFAWNGLGDLYRGPLKRHEEAEKAYLKAIAINPKNGKWNRLGNLYQDHLKQYEKAEKVYRQDIALNEDNNNFAKFNLIFLLRDRLDRRNEAKDIFNALTETDKEGLLDTFYLHQALFSFYEENVGIAIKYWQQAIQEIGDQLPNRTEDDWWRAATIAVKLGYGEKILQVMREANQHQTLRPFYEAIVALHKGNIDYLNDVAAEVRPAAKIIFEWMQDHLN